MPLPSINTAPGLNYTGTAPLVILPSSTQPSYDQTIIGCYSSQGENVEEFRGIPYATVSSRWEHSILRTSLPLDTFDATRYGPRCPQPSAPNTTAAFQSHLDFPSDLEESEFECLNLQVSRPSTWSLARAELGTFKYGLPVYVYIHGGALAFGAGTDPVWNPARLIAHSVRIKRPFIVVNVNYRLNIFGFLASDALSSAQATMKGCNFGLIDQSNAIEWVSANIHAFGGNPSEITIGGQSAGGTSVYAHALRALHGQNNNLFRACIMHSPAAGICGPFSMKTANRQFDRLCEYLQLSPLACEQPIQKLRALSSAQLLHAVDILGWGVFSLSLDGTTISSDFFNTPLPHQVQEHNSNCADTRAPLSVLVGVTEMEASIFHEQVSKIRTFDQLTSLVDLHLSAPDSQRLLQAYNFRKEDDTASHDAIYTLLTDALFGKPMQDSCEMLGRLGANVSSYYFRPGNPFPGPFFGNAIHCADLIYIYDCFYEALQDVDQQETGSHNVVHPRTHRMLVDIAQTNIAHFVTSTSRTAARNDVLVYERDKTVTLANVKADLDTRARFARYEIIRSCWPEVQSLCTDIVQLGFSVRHK